MAEISTGSLHERADAAAGQGDFKGALQSCAEALRIEPLDHRARLKVALCFAALGQIDQAVAVLQLVAEILSKGGFTLPAIGACRDALGFKPGAIEIQTMLKTMHKGFAGVEARGRARVPPPIPPTMADTDAEESLLKLDDIEGLLQKAWMIATKPVEREWPQLEPAPVPLFSDLAEEAFISLVGKMNYLKLPSGHPIVKEGEEGTSLFVLVHGEVSIFKGEDDDRVQLAKLGAGSLFGELALITANPRSATVVTTQASELFEIERKTVEEVAATNPNITEDLVKFARRRLLMNLMATSKLFSPFDDAQRLAILKSFVSRVVSAGTVVINDGDDPQGLFLVLEGEVEVSKIDEAGDKVVLAYLKGGDVFGEIALIEESPTTATVTAATKAVLLHLDKQQFQEFTKDHPKILEYLSGVSGERKEETEMAMSSEGVILEADDLIIL